MSTIKLLGYVEEDATRTAKDRQPQRGALAKYLSDLGLTLKNVIACGTNDLFPEEIKMIDEVMSWRMGKTG